MGEDYLLYAEAKGLPERQIMNRYALRKSLLPQATGLALSLGFIMGGQLLIETLFLYLAWAICSPARCGPRLQHNHGLDSDIHL